MSRDTRNKKPLRPEHNEPLHGTQAHEARHHCVMYSNGVLLVCRAPPEAAKMQGKKKRAHMFNKKYIPQYLTTIKIRKDKARIRDSLS